MANALENNITKPLAKSFLKGAESARVLSKNVNTQFVEGSFNASTGTEITIKRPTDFITRRTATGDISAQTATDIETAKASATVQPYFTEYLDWDEVDEALKMDQLDELIAPVASRLITDLELDFASYMMKNSNQMSGTVGTAISAWSDIANMGATLTGAGVPKDKKWFAAINPYVETVLADAQNSLGAGGSAGSLISDAYKTATIKEDYAGMCVMKATTMDSYTTAGVADAVGIVASDPDVTYATNGNSMIQSIAVSGFTSGAVVKAGTQIQITGRNRLNLSTRKPVIIADGSNIAFTGTVTADVTLTGGAGTLLVAGPAIYEAGKPYNTVDSAVVTNDVVTLLGIGAGAASFQPSMFWYKDAFTIGSVPIKRLNATDTFVKSSDGLQFRVTKWADEGKNTNLCRFDLHPAYGVLNPFYAGHGYG